MLDVGESAGQGVLVGLQRVAEADVGAELDDLVERAVLDIEIAALAAGQGVAGEGGVGAAVEGVVAGVADEVVGAGEAGELVVQLVAGEGVVERVAGAVDLEAGEQLQVLDVGAERVGDGALDRVGAAGQAGHALRHGVALVVDEVEIVAGAAGHLVGAGAALQAIGAVVAGQGVVQGAAGKAVVAGIADDGVGKRVAGAVDVAGSVCVRFSTLGRA
jgi:hypothetical protein